MADETNYRPLEGVKVLELSTMVAAGSCGRMLADWGATVIKVEAESGDMFRNFPKTFLGPLKCYTNVVTVVANKI